MLSPLYQMLTLDSVHRLRGRTRNRRFSLRTLSKTGFGELDEQARGFLLPDSVKAQTVPEASSHAAQKAGNASMNTPQTNFAYCHFANSTTTSTVAVQPMSKGIAGRYPTPTPAHVSIGDPFGQFLENVLLPVGKTLIDKIGKDGVDFVDLVKNHDMDSLRTFAFDLVDTALSVIEALVDGLLKFVEDLISDLQGVLGDELDMHIIKQLYEWLIELLGDGEKFSIVNGLSFVISIPLVTMWRIALVAIRQTNMETSSWSMRYSQL
jgi:hypothetical protein